MSTYRVASRAYGTPHQILVEKFSQQNFNDLIEKTYNNNGAFGYICVKGPNNDNTVSNWQQDPDLECSWTFVSPNLIKRNSNGLLRQAHETNNVKHYVLSRDVTSDPVFTGDIESDVNGNLVSTTGSKKWSQFTS